METCIEYCEPGWAFVSSDERRWHTRIRKLAEQYPDEMVILKQPEENDGVIYAKFPPRWALIHPPRTRELSDEQREALAERLRQYRENSKTQAGERL